MSPGLAEPSRIDGALRFEFHPWRLSGVVVASAINDLQRLSALGDAVHAAPYKAPPRAPVLHVKPRNTQRAGQAELQLPAEAEGFELGATLGLVMAREASHVAAAQALSCVAGWSVVADLSLPHDSLYRPAARLKARDGSCIVGAPVAVTPGADPANVVLTVAVEGLATQQVSMAGLLRPAAQLIADVSEFMTLHPGDLLLLGVRHGMPLVRRGQSFSVDAQGLAGVKGRVVATMGDDA
jgi:5-oxopent-3-ene-1,2,5-tricarboxylate decarboxylase/2-hydroxyhepta-2,4-diene-1,7-dioate isomerase